MKHRNRPGASLLVVTLVLPWLAIACGKTVGETIDDATITTRVKTALLNDQDVDATRIDVSTTAGVVTLSGEVRSKGDADRAVQVTRAVPGVKDVREALKVTGLVTSNPLPGRALQALRSRAASRSHPEPSAADRTRSKTSRPPRPALRSGPSSCGRVRRSTSRPRRA